MVNPMKKQDQIEMKRVAFIGTGIVIFLIGLLLTMCSELDDTFGTISVLAIVTMSANPFCHIGSQRRTEMKDWRGSATGPCPFPGSSHDHLDVASRVTITGKDRHLHWADTRHRTDGDDRHYDGSQ
jgi:hypothetical protein